MGGFERLRGKERRLDRRLPLIQTVFGDGSFTLTTPSPILQRMNLRVRERFLRPG